MKRPDEDRLVNELLGEEHLEASRQATLDAGLRALRQQRRRRTLARTCCLLLLAVGGVVWIKDLLVRNDFSLARFGTLPITQATARTPAVRIITDEELFALFPNRPMALVGKPGQQQLVFLDQPEPAVRTVTQ